MKRSLIWIAILCLLTPLLSAAAPARRIETRTLCPWKIAFVRKGDIWTANGDGTGQKLIIKNGSSPAWSPDHKRIAFARGVNIYVANADGTAEKRLTDYRKGDAADVEISWRPGHDQITFSHYDGFHVVPEVRRPGKYARDELWVHAVSIFNVSTKGYRQDSGKPWFDIIDQAGFSRFSYNASLAWSSKGDSLLFVRNGDIWIAERSAGIPGGRPGWEITRLKAVASYDEATNRADNSNYVAQHLSWSPDGKYAAYGFGRSSAEGEVRLMKLQHSEAGDIRAGQDTLLAGMVALWPTFSPDSKFVAYETPGNVRGHEIWVVSVESGARVKLIANGEQPAW